jgi:general secretion pathway protein G
MKFQVSSFKFQVSKFEFWVSMSRTKPKLGTRNLKPETKKRGFTLLELIVTLSVLSVLVLGTIPLAQNAVKRQKELRLRESLRMLRNAIDEFHRDSVGACPQGAVVTGNPTQQGGNIPADPRSRVVIDDCKIFDNENLDRFPPDLETLVKGVRVKARGLNIQQQQRGVFDDKNATDSAETKEITKVYLREMPIDPVTGKTEWDLRSSYQTKDSGSWDEVNVFDVRSTSDEEALNGEKYSDW